VAPGNHDQTPNGDPEGTTTYYNQYFGVERFEDRSYYGGNYGHNNDEHYSLFSVSGLDFIAIDLEYDQSGVDMGALSWADGLLDSYPDHRAIVVAHHLLESNGSLSDQGELVYGALGHHDNLFLSVCGHLTGEVWRSDPVGESGTFYSLMADYQFGGDGGAGWLRIMQFSPSSGTISVSTYSPWLDDYQDDDDSLFELAYSMEPGGWELLGSETTPAGEQVSLRWSGLRPGAGYQWFAQVSDEDDSTTGETWSFTAGEGAPDTGDTGGPDDNDHWNDTGSRDCGCLASGSAQTPWALWLLLPALATRRRGGRA